MINTFKRLVLRDIVLQILDIKSLEILRNTYTDYVAWTGASVHPTALVYILNDITIHQRKKIVECGSGISTLFIASQLKNLGRKGSFYSIEHDKKWIKILQDRLKKMDLQEYVHVIHAPLCSCKNGWEKHYKWYDINVLEKYKDLEDIDLLFIDGPPANQKNLTHSRYPGLPHFYNRLGKNYTIILDDACRKPEIEIVQKWQKDLGLNFKKEILKGDIWINTKGNFYNVL